mmetsp:Transcript_10731/g.34330  ORF Transcript_10731/g.34330 Transcript_10731/m.34330 type:complete len:685 (-) Transcript_10731:395-2449(-)
MCQCTKPIKMCQSILWIQRNVTFDVNRLNWRTPIWSAELRLSVPKDDAGVLPCFFRVQEDITIKIQVPRLAACSKANPALLRPQTSPRVDPHCLLKFDYSVFAEIFKSDERNEPQPEVAGTVTVNIPHASCPHPIVQDECVRYYSNPNGPEERELVAIPARLKQAAKERARQEQSVRWQADTGYGQQASSQGKRMIMSHESMNAALFVLLLICLLMRWLLRWQLLLLGLFGRMFIHTASTLLSGQEMGKRSAMRSAMLNTARSEILKAETWVLYCSTGPACAVLCVVGCVTMLWGLSWQPSWQPSRVAACVFILIEALWWIGQQIAMRWWLEPPNEPLEPPDDESSAGSSRWQEAREAIGRILDDLNGDEGRKFVSRWFLDVLDEDLSQDSFRRWWTWVSYCDTSYDEVKHKEVDSDMEKIEAKLGPLQKEGDIPRIRLNVDSVRQRVATKPFWLYLLLRCYIGIFGSGVWMRALGFKRERHGSLWFWIIRLGGSEPPLLFLHSIGIGIFPYIPFVYQLLNDRKVRCWSAVIVPDLAYISVMFPLALFLRGGAPDRDAHLEAIDKALEWIDPGCPKFVDIFPHSYGTVVAAWMIRRKSSVVRTATLAEPVALLIHHAPVARSVLYDLSESHFESLRQAVIKRIDLMDVVNVFVLMRNFWWFENTIFVQDLENLPQPPPYPPLRE